MPIFSAFSPLGAKPPGWRWCSVLLACFSLLGAGAARADALEEASQLLKSGQHAKALDQIDKHLASKPKDAQGRFLKGIILTGMNKQGEAIVVFRKLTEDFPELPEPYNNLAVIYAQQKQYDKAKEALEMAIRTHPAYATAHENLGDIYSRLASQAYGKALQIDSSNASAQIKLAMINDLVGKEKVGAGRAAAPTAPVAPVVVAAADPVKPPLVPVAKADAPKPEVVKPEPARQIESPKPPAESRPAQKPEPARAETTKPGEPAVDIAAAVDGWLNAWSRKDVKTYLAYYARDFQPPKGQSRKEWETERSQRVGKPGKIEVGRDKLAIKTEGSDKATVHFRQQYKSATLSTNSGKTLLMIRQDGRWLIQQERVGG